MIEPVYSTCTPVPPKPAPPTIQTPTTQTPHRRRRKHPGSRERAAFALLRSCAETLEAQADLLESLSNDARTTAKSIQIAENLLK